MIVKIYSVNILQTYQSTITLIFVKNCFFFNQGKKLFIATIIRDAFDEYVVSVRKKWLETMLIGLETNKGRFYLCFTKHLTILMKP